jgi:gamma-glutamylcyclotransferase (GGCT)/AIG2-like uncharacterized protein YtfP
MRSFNNDFAEYLKSNSDFVAKGLMRGCLYLIEDDFLYPAATYSPELSATIKGEVLRLHHPDTVMNELDVYEGIDSHSSEVQPYSREVVEVYSEDTKYHCIAYIYKWSTAHLPVIKSGNFMDI